MKFNKKRYKKYQPSIIKSAIRQKCLVCNLYINLEMKDCQPCAGAVPIYSNLHKIKE